MIHRIMTFALATLCGLADAALAQGQMTFRLAAGDRNPSVCVRADTGWALPHTFIIANNAAVIRWHAGINDTAKMVSPGIYRTRWSFAGGTYDIEINASAVPATVSVTDAKVGCKWTGQASAASG
jgi:hypothetical protein